MGETLGEQIRKMLEKEQFNQQESPEQEQEIKPGKYELFMELVNYKEEKINTHITDITVYKGQTREEVIKNARSWLVMAGAHNYGMRYVEKEFNGSKKRVGEVKLMMKSPEDGKVVYEADFNIDGSGYIVKEEK